SVEQTLVAMSPVYEVRDGARLPAFLLAHGDADEVVPYSQSERMHRRLKEAGADSRLIRVRGAGHEGSFWSAALHAEILRFFRKHL
ncbi:MAG: prolyl oligopeptidase family serine peptidase, partial [Clostridiales bacterium]|nr:prolyl oligopeptidase family serine peptidase [Clostridiales bacterium]